MSGLKELSRGRVERGRMGRRDFLKFLSVAAGLLLLPDFSRISGGDEDDISKIREEVTPEQSDFLAGHPLKWGDRRRKVAMMTYDDLVRKKEEIDSILGAFQGRGKATFFLSGDKLEQCASYIEQIIESGNTFACHGWGHGLDEAMTVLSENRLRTDFEKFLKTSDTLFPGYKIKFFRAPFGSVNKKVLQIGAEYGMQHVSWSRSSGGEDEKTVERVVTNPENGMIVLSHIPRYYDYSKAGVIVDSLLEQGFSLESVETGRDPKDVYQNTLKVDLLLREQSFLGKIYSLLMK